MKPLVQWLVTQLILLLVSLDLVGWGWKVKLNFMDLNDEWDLSGYNLYRQRLKALYPPRQSLLKPRMQMTLYTDSSILTGTLFLRSFSADISGTKVSSQQRL